MFGPEITAFVDDFHMYGYWNVFVGRKNDNLKKIGFGVRLVLFTLLSVVAIIKIADDGVQSVLNGSAIFLPLLSYAWIIPVMLFIKRDDMCNFLRDVDECRRSLKDPSDVVVFRYFDDRVKRFTHIVRILTNANAYFYVPFPILVDTVLHYIFGWLSKPFVIAYPHMGFLGQNATWDSAYYTVAVCGGFCCLEISMALWGWLFLYASIVGFCYPVLVITKRAIQDLKDDKGYDQVKIDKAVKCHRLLVKLNTSLKKFFGLPCAFHIPFTSVALTLTLFTAVGTSDLFVRMGYGSAFSAYVFASLVYCLLGQMLKNQSEDMCTEFYNAPWYRYRHFERKEILMMLRQSQRSFTIDFHGSYTMDLENFMEIVKSAYSLFTLLQTLTSN